MLLPLDFDESETPPPEYLTVPGEGVRLHLKAKQLGDVVRKSLFDQKKGGGGGWGSLLESAATALGTEITETQGVESGTKRAAGPVKITNFPLSGKSPRVDFSLQTAVIDSEYIRCDRCCMFALRSARPFLSLTHPCVVAHSFSDSVYSAVTAHSSYFANSDVLDFLIGIFSAGETDALQASSS